ncbi:hypothetical protein, partial [Halorubrum sp. Boch-26]|uniref:hypothetical protein n=1 Tax=Halorubrum sp. Boch-26 TaxID=2994426 RepID=UPI00246994BE
MGMTLMSAEADKDQSLNISESGDVEKLLSFENTHTISDIKIEPRDVTDSKEYLTIYLNFKELQNIGVDMSNTIVENSTISNGIIAKTSNMNINGEAVLMIQIKRLNLGGSVQIESVQLGGINGSEGETSTNLQYRVGAINGDSTSSYDELKTSGNLKNSSEFDFADASMTVQDQATVSTNFARDTRTSSGVTVSELIADVNSTVVLTHPDNGEIVGHKSLTVQQMDGEGSISLNTSNLGGGIRAYLIPSKQINIKQNNVTKLPSELKRLAIAKDQAHVYLGTVRFENQKHEAEATTNISIATIEVRDTVGMKTPYVVSIHPITAGGNVVYEKYIGYSEVLTGVHDSLTIPARDTMGNRNTIWQSNQFVAVIRLAEGQEQGEPVNLNSTKPLPNSDIRDQFVNGGVSDSANIHVSNIKPDQGNSTRVDRQYNHTKQNSKIVYSGELIGIKNVTSSNTVRLYRRATSNRSIISGIGTYSNNTDNVIFDTTG